MTMLCILDLNPSSDRQGYFDKYDPTINPSAAQGFTTAAYRFGHSLLPSTVGREICSCTQLNI
jgi:hypothetical protein